jgi:hypothetical protein
MVRGWGCYRLGIRRTRAAKQDKAGDGDAAPHPTTHELSIPAVWDVFAGERCPSLECKTGIYCEQKHMSEIDRELS